MAARPARRLFPSCWSHRLLGEPLALRLSAGLFACHPRGPGAASLDGSRAADGSAQALGSPFFVSLSVALAFTLLFGFRHGAWRRPRYLLGYFAFFFALEWAAEAWLIPPQALGHEVAYVCLGISALCLIALFITRRVERDAERQPENRLEE